MQVSYIFIAPSTLVAAIVLEALQKSFLSVCTYYYLQHTIKDHKE